jgi:hypothetical protein
VGLNAYHALDRSAAGLAHLSNVHIPKQRIASELTGDLFTAHLKIFQFVSWRQVGVSAKTVQATSGEALAQLERLGAGLQRFRTLSHQSPAEARRMAALGEKWAKYVAEMHDVVAAADNDASMASMLLGATDDEFRTIVAELQRMAAQVADQTRATS